MKGAQLQPLSELLASPGVQGRSSVKAGGPVSDEIVARCGMATQ